MGVRNFFLLGPSFGGLVAVDCAVRYPENVKKILLISIVFNPPTVRLKMLRLIWAYLKLIGNSIFRYSNHELFFLWAVDAVKCLVSHPRAMLREPLIAFEALGNQYSDIKADVKLIIGNKDEFIREHELEDSGISELVDVEVVDGYHCWYFYSKDNFNAKVSQYFHS